MRETFSLLRSVCWMIPMLGVITTVMGLLSILSSIVDSTGEVQQGIARRWGRMLMSVFLVDVRLLGSEHLTANQPYVFASNHFSLIDTPLMFGFMPRSFRILARSGLWTIPFIGWHLSRAGHLPVDRQNPRRAARNIEDAARRVEGGLSILVFPEGGRRRGKRMRRFKTGAAHIALEAGVPIVPMAIAGSGSVLPPGSWHLRPGVVELRIGNPVPTRNRNGLTARTLTDELQEAIAKLAARAPATASQTTKGKRQA